MKGRGTTWRRAARSLSRRAPPGLRAMPEHLKGLRRHGANRLTGRFKDREVKDRVAVCVTGNARNEEGTVGETKMMMVIRKTVLEKKKNKKNTVIQKQ